MTQALPNPTTRIHEYSTPRSNIHSSASPRWPMPGVQQQHNPRYIRLSDIQKHKKPQNEKKAARPSARADLDSFWSWLSGLLDNIKTKASAQSTNNITHSKVSASQRSHPVLALSGSGNPNLGHSAAWSIDTRIRENQRTAREDQLEYEAQHYSLWGEIVYIYKTLKESIAKKKAEAARQRRREARQKARDGRPKVEVVCGSSTILQGEKSSPARHPTPSPILPLPPRPLQQIKVIGPESHSVITGKPVPVFSKTEGEVTKHAVKITHFPPVHNSVHLMQIAANSHDPCKEIEIDHKRKSSNVTIFGDFMRKPSESSEGLARLPPHIPEPVALRESQPIVANFYRQRQGTQWTFTVPGIDDGLARNSTLILPNVDFPETISEERESQVMVDPQECILCGTLNSPKTSYNQQGLWLCTACRSPTSPREVPPPPAVTHMVTPIHHKNRSRSSSRKKTSTVNYGENEGATCTHEPFSDPESMHASMKPAPLNSLRSRRSRSHSVDSPVSPLTEDPFANFDAELNSTSRRQAPLSPEFKAIVAQRPRYDKMVDDVSPPPPLKDDHAYWPSKVLSRAISEAPLLSSKSFKPSKPQSAWSQSTLRNSNRLSYYPDTPITPKMLPETPNSPTIPQRPKFRHNPLPQPPTSPPRRARTSSANKSKGRKTSKSKETMELRTPPGIPSDFPFAPPPIPDDTLHKPKRSSSIYPEDNDERYRLPPFEFATRLKSSGEKRDTSFYDFWKTILEERKE